MSTRALSQITFLIALAGCCTTHSIDVETLSASALGAQVREYERARREHCIPHENRGILISEMGNHGREAATAMIEILKHPVAGFPPEDAIDVLESVYRLGVDLRDPETQGLLAGIEATSSDGFVRARAKDALWRMRTYAPGELQQPEINHHR